MKYFHRLRFIWTYCKISKFFCNSCVEAISVELTQNDIWEADSETVRRKKMSTRHRAFCLLLVWQDGYEDVRLFHRPAWCCLMCQWMWCSATDSDSWYSTATMWRNVQHLCPIEVSIDWCQYKVSHYCLVSEHVWKVLCTTNNIHLVLGPQTYKVKTSQFVAGVL